MGGGRPQGLNPNNISLYVKQKMEEGKITEEESRAIAKVMKKIKNAEKGKRRSRRKVKGPQEGRSKVPTPNQSPTNPEGSRTNAAQHSHSQATTSKQKSPTKDELNATSSKNPDEETIYLAPQEVIDWIAVEGPTAPTAPTVAYKSAAHMAFQTAVECHTSPYQHHWRIFARRD